MTKNELKQKMREIANLNERAELFKDENYMDVTFRFPDMFVRAWVDIRDNYDNFDIKKDCDTQIELVFDEKEYVAVDEVQDFALNILGLQNIMYRIRDILYR